MKRKAILGFVILFFFPFIWQSKANTITYNSSLEEILAPPLNDECANATSLIVNQNYLCGSVTAGTVLEATASGGPNFCSSSTNANDDVWFKFVATATSHRIQLLNIVGSQTDLYHMVYDGGAGGICPTSEMPIFCSDPETSNQTGLTIGNTYFVRVFTKGAAEGDNTTFNICIGSLPTAPTNDSCANAEAITSLPFDAMYDASGATNNSGFITASGCIGMNDGVWYTLTGNGGDFTVTVEPTSWNAGIAIYTGSCGSFTCVDDSNIGGNNIVEATTFPTVNGTTYYVNIGHPSGTVDGTEGIFNLSVTSTVLSIEDIIAKGFSYYPNPVKDVLKMNANEPINQISIYSILGRELKTINQSNVSTEVDFSGFPSGTYFVRAVVGSSSGAFKIIKN
jgi:hypothetical protein